MTTSSLAAIDGFIRLVAVRKSGVKNWEPFKVEAAGADHVVTGGVPRLLSKGPRKGKKVWDGKTNSVVVTNAEISAEKIAYSRTTGKCAECSGTGKEMVRWSTADGARLEHCRFCNGSGKSAS